MVLKYYAAQKQRLDFSGEIKYNPKSMLKNMLFMISRWCLCPCGRQNLLKSSSVNAPFTHDNMCIYRP